MRNGILFIGIAFAVALAVIIGNRLSAEAMAVVVGAVCGISATIPVSLGLVIAASHHWGAREAPREIEYDYGTQRYAAQQPMIIFAPPQAPAAPYGVAPQQYYLLPSSDNLAASREFKIVGEE